MYIMPDRIHIEMKVNSVYLYHSKYLFQTPMDKGVDIEVVHGTRLYWKYT